MPKLNWETISNEVIAGLILTFVLAIFGVIAGYIKSERFRNQIKRQLGSRAFTAALSIVVILGALTCIVMVDSIPINQSSEITQTTDSALSTPEETEPSTVEQSPTNTDVSPTVPIVSPTSTTVPTPYYVDQPFGCHIGKTVKYDRNSCRAVRLSISSERHGVPLMICSHGVPYNQCPAGLLLSELADSLEWRFIVTNSGTGSVRIHPTVIIGNRTTGELGRAFCNLGTTGDGVQLEEDDAKKWNVLDGEGQRMSVYCSLIAADYSKVDWAVALVDYDVNGMRYYVSQQYIDTEGQEARTLAEAGVLHNDWKPHIEYIAGGDMALVPKGCFMMGREDGDDDERPVHEVCFEHPFWIDVTEVTNYEFTESRVEADNTGYWSDEERPRENVTWNEASQNCGLRGIRLATEAEWEYAARGPDNLKYPWGNDFEYGDHVIYAANSKEQTWDVGSKPSGASWVGTLDMSGNVWEWVYDWFGEYPPDKQVDPDGPESGTLRVLRGGAFDGKVDETLHTTDRWNRDPEGWNYNIGFRCACPYESDGSSSCWPLVP